MIFLDLVVLFGGAAQWWGGGVMTSMRMRLVFSFRFLDLVVLFGGAVQWWGVGGWGGGGWGGGVVHANATCFFCSVLLLLLSTGRVCGETTREPEANKMQLVSLAILKKVFLLLCKLRIVAS